MILFIVKMLIGKTQFVVTPFDCLIWNLMLHGFYRVYIYDIILTHLHASDIVYLIKRNKQFVMV